jgi:hypothetical protein
LEASPFRTLPIKMNSFGKVLIPFNSMSWASTKLTLTGDYLMKNTDFTAGPKVGGNPSI